MSANPGPYRRKARFVLDGRVVELQDFDPHRTLLQYLREDLRRTGTKEGCAEGDCGACTVVIADVDESGRRLKARAVNACICFLATLDGKELVTVESLASNDLHPVQQAMVDCHGSQCGFCTPGFVMSLFALYKTNPQPSRTEIDDALAGNLCRCTGYRPIVEAAQRMYVLAPKDKDWHQLPAGQPAAADEAEHVSRLRSLVPGRSLQVASERGKFFAPRRLAELAEIFIAHPGATLLAGGTDVGLWVTKQHRNLDVLVYTGSVAELQTTTVMATHINLGAAVTLTDAAPVITRFYPALQEIFTRFASPPIRNAATLGGNIANGSPVGDSMPALLVLGASLRLRRGGATRQLALQEFYTGYRKNALRAGEFIERILIPLPRRGELLQSYKVSKRFDQDISAVCGAWRVELDGNRVRSASVAYGGMAEVVRRARRCEAALTGAEWGESAIDKAMAALDEDFSPISDMRSSRTYRQRVAKNLLKRFYLESRGSKKPARVYYHGR